PSNIFVASFIGTPQMNLIPATVLEPADGVPTFDIGGQKVAIPLKQGMRLGDRVTLGIRPRSLEPVAQPGPETIAAKVDLIEPMGAETLFHLIDREHQLRVVVDRTYKAQAGEQLALRFRPEHTHIFDANEQLVQP
ncbi:MAG: TOBE domain-containing protein, partial [Alphaproteobacteria bacterium]